MNLIPQTTPTQNPPTLSPAARRAAAKMAAQNEAARQTVIDQVLETPAYDPEAARSIHNSTSRSKARQNRMNKLMAAIEAGDDAAVAKIEAQIERCWQNEQKRKMAADPFYRICVEAAA